MIHHPAETTLFHLQSLYPANPAAGAQYSATMTDLGRDQLVAVAFTLQTDATGANRFPTIRIISTARIVTRCVYVNPVIASQFAYIHFAIGLLPQEALSGTDRIINSGLPHDLILVGPTTYTIQIENIQATDQIANITIWYRHWHQSTFSV